MKVVSDGLRKRLPTLLELWLYGKKALTGGNGLASPLPSHAEAYNLIKLQPCAAHVTSDGYILVLPARFLVPGDESSFSSPKSSCDC